MLITAIFSLVFGLALVFHRDKLVRKISNHIDEKKRKQLKENNQRGLQTTLKKIGTRNKKIKFDFIHKTTFKERTQKMASKFSKPKKGKEESVEYIEIK